MTQSIPGSSATIELRVAVADDLPEMTRIRTGVRENHMSVDEMAAVGITPASIIEMMATTSRAWIASVGGQPAGFSMAISPKATVFALFVHPDFEGRGIGARLLAQAETWLFGQGCDEIWLDTSTKPEIRAHGFYLRQGWRVKGPGTPGELRYTKLRRADSPSSV